MPINEKYANESQEDFLIRQSEQATSGGPLGTPQAPPRPLHYGVRPPKRSRRNRSQWQPPTYTPAQSGGLEFSSSSDLAAGPQTWVGGPAENMRTHQALTSERDALVGAQAESADLRAQVERLSATLADLRGSYSDLEGRYNHIFENYVDLGDAGGATRRDVRSGEGLDRETRDRLREFYRSDSPSSGGTYADWVRGGGGYAPPLDETDAAPAAAKETESVSEDRPVPTAAPAAAMESASEAGSPMYSGRSTWRTRPGLPPSLPPRGDMIPWRPFPAPPSLPPRGDMIPPPHMPFPDQSTPLPTRPWLPPSLPPRGDMVPDPLTIRRLRSLGNRRASAGYRGYQAPDRRNQLYVSGRE